MPERQPLPRPDVRAARFVLLMLCVIGIACARLLRSGAGRTPSARGRGRVGRGANNPLHFAFDVCEVGQPPVRALRLRVRAGEAAAVSPPCVPSFCCDQALMHPPGVPTGGPEYPKTLPGARCAGQRAGTEVVRRRSWGARVVAKQACVFLQCLHLRVYEPRSPISGRVAPAGVRVAG